MGHSFGCGVPFGMPPGQQEDPCSFVIARDTGETCLLSNQFSGDMDPVPEDFGMCVPNKIIP